MGRAFDSLTHEQKSNFYHRLEQLGLDRSDISQELRAGDYPGGCILGDDPSVSYLRPQMRAIQTLAALRQLGGIPDQHYLEGRMEGHPDVPLEWPQEKNNLSSTRSTPSSSLEITRRRSHTTPKSGTTFGLTGWA
jgi:hypothetical protein